jgi:hypothetical protein
MKNIITVEEWDDFSKRIKFKYAHDNYMFEMKEVNVMQERLNQLQLISPFAGTYFSVAWIKKNILKQSDEEIKLIQKDLSVEDKQGLYDVEVEDDTNKNKGKK